jgi:hypothetical protein
MHWVTGWLGRGGFGCNSYETKGRFFIKKCQTHFSCRVSRVRQMTVTFKNSAAIEFNAMKLPLRLD